MFFASSEAKVSFSLQQLRPSVGMQITPQRLIKLTKKLGLTVGDLSDSPKILEGWGRVVKPF